MKTTRVEKVSASRSKGVYQAILYLKWLIYLTNIISLLSLAYVVPQFLKEARDIDQGKITLEVEYQAEEQKGEDEVNYQRIRSNSAKQSRYMMLIGITISGSCSICLFMAAFATSYCWSFIPCVLLTIPIAAAILDIRSTQKADFKVLSIVINSVNCALAYVFSCLVKSYEYTRSAMKPIG